MPQQRQYFLRAENEFEMNEWINLINYASAFKTAQLRIRGTIMGQDRAVLAGAAAAASHKRDLEAIERSSQGSADVSKVTTPTSEALAQIVPAETPLTGAEVTGNVANEGEQLEEVFGTVKAELAAGRGTAGKRISAVNRSSIGSAVDSVVVTRAEVIQTRIKGYEAKVKAARATLRTNLCTARNLAILTPFHKVTRDRVAHAVGPLAQKIRQNRLEIARLQIWIDILRRDAVTEQREMARLRHVALQAAAKSLADPQGVRGVVEDVNASTKLNGARNVPTLSLPEDNGQGKDKEGDLEFSKSPAELPINIRRLGEPADDDKDVPTTEDRRTPKSPRRGSSEFESDVRRRSSSDLLGSRPVSPGHEDEDRTGSSTPVLFAISDVEDAASEQPELVVKKKKSYKGKTLGHSSALGKPSAGPAKGDVVDPSEQQTAEEAEEWMKTRAARRVSLATIPDLQPSTSINRGAGQRKDKEYENEKTGHDI